MHDVFLVSFIKPYRDDGRVQPPPLPELIHDESELEVEHILRHCRLKRGCQRDLEDLLKGYGPEHDMWLEGVTQMHSFGPWTHVATGTLSLFLSPQI